jgi:TRAP-type C4-dicarboxylate transport system permease small subunit|tara:strand:- start:185101 stop:185616 length:516 start_codon:yes stop_codon:yes gene_type:complete
MLRTIDRAIISVTGVLVVVLLLIMTGATLAGVFARYFLNDALTWSEEVARFSMIWLSFLGGGLVFRRGGHVAIDMLVRRLSSDAVRIAVFTLSQLVIMAFLGTLLWYGVDMVQQATYMTTPALQISMMFPYAAIPVGAVLMMYQLVVVSVKTYRGEHAEGHLASDLKINTD